MLLGATEITGLKDPNENPLRGVHVFSTMN